MKGFLKGLAVIILGPIVAINALVYGLMALGYVFQRFILGFSEKEVAENLSHVGAFGVFNAFWASVFTSELFYSFLLFAILAIGVLVIIYVALRIEAQSSPKRRKWPPPPNYNQPASNKEKVMGALTKVEPQGLIVTHELEQSLEQIIANMRQLIAQGIPNPFFSGEWELKRQRNVTALMEEQFKQFQGEYYRLCALIDVQQGLQIGTTAKAKTDNFLHDQEIGRLKDKYALEEDHDWKMKANELRAEREKAETTVLIAYKRKIRPELGARETLQQEIDALIDDREHIKKEHQPGWEDKVKIRQSSIDALIEQLNKIHKQLNA